MGVVIGSSSTDVPVYTHVAGMFEDGGISRGSLQKAADDGGNPISKQVPDKPTIESADSHSHFLVFSLHERKDFPIGPQENAQLSMLPVSL
jgi:hypothetical protein